MYDAVYGANKAAREFARPGMTCEAVDAGRAPGDRSSWSEASISFIGWGTALV